METDIRQIDWSAAWADAQMRNRPDRPYGDPSFWNKRARKFADRHTSQNGYPEAFISRLDLAPGFSVLDVGCGPGTLAIPLAKKVDRITALDFSETMLSILKERMEETQVTNIDPILMGIDDEWESRGMVPHDLVIASRSTATHDLKGMLSKLTRFARKQVVISAMVGKGPFDPRIIEAAGRKREAGPDYIYVINQLYRMGIYASLDFIVQNIERSYESHEAAVEDCRWMIEAMTQDEAARLYRFFKGNLEKRDGRWFLSGSEPVRWAVIRWNSNGERGHGAEND